LLWITEGCVERADREATGAGSEGSRRTVGVLAAASAVPQQTELELVTTYSVGTTARSTTTRDE
jgi:hypothetical protein